MDFSTKSSFRAEVRRRVAALPAEERRQASLQVARQLLDDAIYRRSRHVLAYWALPDELDLGEFIRQQSSEKQFYLPVVNGDDLLVKPLTPNLVEGAFSIGEPTGDLCVDPTVLDYVIVPGRGFDAAGNRLGRGKGFYDRFLPKTSAYCVGVCFACQVFGTLPHDSSDRPVQQLFFA